VPVEDQKEKDRRDYRYGPTQHNRTLRFTPKRPDEVEHDRNNPYSNAHNSGAYRQKKYTETALVHFPVTAS
jgi:hypothetical protein